MIKQPPRLGEEQAGSNSIDDITTLVKLILDNKRLACMVVNLWVQEKGFYIIPKEEYNP